MTRNHSAWAAPLLFSMVGLVTAACGEGPKAPDSEGARPGECTDGVDNDKDGLLDCKDADCTDNRDCEPDDNDSPDYCGPYDYGSYYYGYYYDGGYYGDPRINLGGFDFLTIGDSTSPADYDCELVFWMYGYEVPDHSCVFCDYVFDVRYQFLPTFGWGESNCVEYQEDRRELIGINRGLGLWLSYGDDGWTEHRYERIEFDPEEYDLLAYMRWETGYKDYSTPGELGSRFTTYHHYIVAMLYEFP